jgi:glycosyltransferase involved in cell wall biosynthesis
MTTRPSGLTVLATTPTADLYGSARMLLESVEGFTDRDWRVVVSLPGPGPLVDEILRRGGEVRFVPSPVLRKTYLTVRGAARLARLTLRSARDGTRLIREVQPDVMFVNTITEPLWLALGRAARRPIVCHVHEGEASAPRLVRKAISWPLLVADRLVVNSRFSTRVLTDAVPRLAGRCELIYNGVPGPPVVTPPRAELSGPVRLLYVGRLSERKGVRDAIDAVSELGARGVVVELDIVGDVFPGYEEVAKDLHLRANTLGLAERVRFGGFDRDVWRHLAAADILLVPSRVDEPFGNTAVEGALASRPVVASTSGGLVEAVEGMQASMAVPPASPGAIADAVEKISQSWPSVRQAAIEDARRASQRYAPSSYRRAMADTLERVASSPPTR